MLSKVKENSGFNKVLICKVLVLLIFISTLLLMRGNESVFRMYSEGAKTLDMRFGYEATDIYHLFSVLGITGRFLYIRHLCIDFVFIASFALVQNYLLKWIMGKSMLDSKWRILLSISYLRGLFDVIENICILALLINFPLELLKLTIVSSFATMLKFILLGLWVVTIPVSFFLRKQLKNV